MFALPEIHASKFRHKVQVLPGCAVGQPDQEGGIFRRQVLTAIKKAEPLVQTAQPAYLALLGSRAVNPDCPALPWRQHLPCEIPPFNSSPVMDATPIA